MSLPTNKLLTLSIVAILVLVLACGTEEDQRPNDNTGSGMADAPTLNPANDNPGTGVTDTPTPTPAGGDNGDNGDNGEDSFPFPVVELIVDGVRYPSAQGGYCWPDSRDGDVIMTLCAAMALDWELDERVPFPIGEDPMIEIDFSESPDSLYANFYRDPQIRSEVDQRDITAEVDRVLDLSGYVVDDIYLRVSGNWPTGQADFLFRLRPIPSGEALTAVCSATEAAPLPLEYQVLNDPAPTGFDGRNNGSCTFNKPIAGIAVGLNNGPQGSFHTETFRFAEPLLEVSFPLKEWDESVSTAELLAPGPYTRTMIAETVDGEQWVITDHITAALDEVTVIASDKPTPMPTREWDIEDVSVDGSTVTVSVRVYSTANYTVVIDGIESDETVLAPPLMHHVFKNVASGAHELSISDIIGHADGRMVQVP
jgi:hypothetical protein